MKTTNERFLFRGKRKDTGAWMQGCLVGFPDSDKHYGIWSANAQSYLWIDPATIGQCTGLYDKNGVLIFEGDVVKLPHEEDGIVARTTGGDELIAKVQWDCIWWEIAWQHNSEIECSHIIDSIECATWEIIGNIHDHKHLLEAHK